MKESPFNPEKQQIDLSSKIIVGLERISEVFKVLLWEKAKEVSLSPIQIKILLFIAFHKDELCKVSEISREFNITKPTVSDAIKVLFKKELIVKDYAGADNRSYTILLSNSGKKMVESIHVFSSPLEKHVSNIDKTQQEDLFETLSKLIFKLNRSGILNTQRTCFGCSFYEKKKTGHYCNLLQDKLLSKDIQLDCPEFKT